MSTQTVAAEALAAARNASAEASAATEYMEPRLAAMLVTMTGIAVEATEAAIKAAGYDAGNLVYWAGGSNEWRVFVATGADCTCPTSPDTCPQRGRHNN